MPKLAFTNWHSYAAGDVSIPTTILCGLTNQGQAFAGLDVLLWGPALEERLIEPSPGIVIRTSHDFKTRDEWSGDLQPFEFEVNQEETDQQTQINGYRYEFPEIAFPEGFIQVLYPETAALLGIMGKRMEKFYHPHISFQFTFTGRSVGDSRVEPNMG